MKKMVLLFCSMLYLTGTGAGAAEKEAATSAIHPERGRAPFVRLATMANNAAQARAINNLAPGEREARIEQLTRWYVHFNCPGSKDFPFGNPSKGPNSPDTTLADRLVARGALVSNYRNGSYISQARRGEELFSEAPALEREAPLAILTWWPGHKAADAGSPDDAGARLAAALEPAATTVRVTSPAAYKPGVAPVTWPYLPSRGKGGAAGAMYSESTADFVSWVRVGDEMMRVLQVGGAAGAIELTVTRGCFGTAPARHARGARVLSPVYIGSIRAVSWDKHLAGSPPVNHPDSPLRYAVMAWQSAPEDPRRDGAGWLARRIAATFGAGQPAPYFQGYNTVWLDITSCSPYNTADAYGQPVMPWDEGSQTPVSAERWTACQIAKIEALRRRLAAMGYPGLKMTANNLAYNGGPDRELRIRLMDRGGLDGAALEHWLQRTATWPAAMEQHFYIQQHDLAAIYWVKTGELDRKFNTLQYKRFTYGSYLLGWNPAAQRPCLASHFGLQAPDELYFRDFGKPLRPAARLADLSVTDGVYRRDFAGGAVLVNPTQRRIRCELNGTYLDVTVARGGQASPRVNSVEIGPADAAFVLNPRD